MFRRWRRARLAAQAAEHVAAPTPAPRPSAADLRGEHIFELLHARLSQFIGSDGEWALVRRSDDDSDRIFHAVVTHQIAAELTRAILDERENVAVVVEEGEQQLVLDWEPSPLVVWADPIALDTAVEPSNEVADEASDAFERAVAEPAARAA